MLPGTRVPLNNLIDYIERGYPLSEFLEDFPTVSDAMAVQALEEAKAWRTTLPGFRLDLLTEPTLSKYISYSTLADKNQLPVEDEVNEK